MKKIMFNDRYGLTQAVLDGKKTMARRIINGDYEDVKAYHANGGWHFIADTKEGDSVEVKPAYEVGETIAIAQSYKTIYDTMEEKEGNWRRRWGWYCKAYDVIDNQFGPATTPGYRNKMFVLSDLMPHRIRITNIKLERLQDISEEDAMREGIHEGEFMNTWDKYYFDEWGDVPNHITFKTPRLAFQSLIDKVCKRGTWESNPWVYVYEFELV